MDAPLKIESFSERTIWCLSKKELGIPSIEERTSFSRARQLPPRKLPVRRYPVNPDQVLHNRPLERVRAMMIHSN